MDIKVLFGTETGNSQNLANEAKEKLSAYGFNVEVLDMQSVSLKDLKNYTNVLLITSTWGDGEPPSNAEDLYNELKSASGSELSNLKYAVFAIGQSFYENFCKVGIDFDNYFENLGAKRIAPIELSDDDFDEKFPIWTNNIKDSLLIKM